MKGETRSWQGEISKDYILNRKSLMIAGEESHRLRGRQHRWLTSYVALRELESPVSYCELKECYAELTKQSQFASEILDWGLDSLQAQEVGKALQEVFIRSIHTYSTRAECEAFPSSPLTDLNVHP